MHGNNQIEQRCQMVLQYKETVMLFFFLFNVKGVCTSGRLKGKVVFITGASSGIGEHTAYALAKAGAKLVLTARRNVELQRVKLQCIG